MKKIFSGLLLILFVLTGVFCNNIVLANEWEQEYKYYTNGIVDGGAYFIKNVQTGLYMSIENNSSVANNNILLTAKTSSDYQKFYVKYLGNDRYTFEPYTTSELKFNIASSAAGEHLTLDEYSSTETGQRFRITAISSMQYTITTCAGSYTKALHAENDADLGWSVVHDEKTTLSENELKWEFEKVDDRARDKYTTYYIRDTNTNLYLTILGTESGSQLILSKFTGGENQRFKKYYLNDGNGYGNYYVSMNKTDMAIKLSGTVSLHIFDKNVSQKFVETSTSNGYKLSSTVEGVSKYIIRGSQFTYNFSTAYYLSPSTDSTVAINFEFETARTETPFLFDFNLNTSINKTLTGYAEEHTYVIRPKITGDYNFFIKRTNSGNPSLSVYDENDIWMPGTVTNYDSGQRYKVTLEKDKIYYIIAADYDAFGSSYTFYCKQDLMVYIHAMNTSYTDGSSFDSRADAAIPSMNLLNSYAYYDPIINTESDMNTTFIRNIDPSTGVVPLKAPIYVFTGHGSSNCCAYSTGTDSSTGTNTDLYASHLYNFTTNSVVFNMTGNIFSAWVGCETAKGTNTIAEAANKVGSICSLGFENSIFAGASNDFIVNLFEEIENGYSISNAVDRAHSGVAFWFSGLESAKFFGDSSIVLKPSIPTTFSSMSVDETEELMRTINMDEYTFMYENNRGTLRRYVKLINGYVSDDYIDIYLENNEIIGYYKSNTTYTSSVNRLTLNYDLLFAENDYFDIPLSINSEGNTYNRILIAKTYEQIYTYNNIIMPVRFYVTTYSNDNGQKYLDIKVVNVKTKTLVNENIIFE